jgi:hypothetical protein
MQETVTESVPGRSMKSIALDNKAKYLDFSNKNNIRGQQKSLFTRWPNR